MKHIDKKVISSLALVQEWGKVTAQSSEQGHTVYGAQGA